MIYYVIATALFLALVVLLLDRIDYHGWRRGMYIEDYNRAFWDWLDTDQYLSTQGPEVVKAWEATHPKPRFVGSDVRVPRRYRPSITRREYYRRCKQMTSEGRTSLVKSVAHAQTHETG